MCDECQVAAGYHLHPIFNQHCKWCWARSIRLCKTFAWTKKQIEQEQARILDAAEAKGYSRQEIRELAKNATVLEMQAQASADPLKKRRKKSSGAVAPTGG